jgi:hypothetical protein
VVADRQCLERCDSHFGYRAYIIIHLVPDNDLWIHTLRIPPSCWPTINIPTWFFPELSWIPALFRQNQEKNISGEIKSVFYDPLGILWQ